MFARTVLALVSSPFYGLLVMLGVLPITIIGNAAVGVLAAFTIIIPVLVIGALIVTQVAIYAQSARFAGSFTGLAYLMDQPDFYASAARCMFVVIIAQIIIGMVIGAIVLVYVEIIDWEQIWWMNPENLGRVSELARKSPEAMAEIFLVEGLNLDLLFLAVRVATMVFITTISIILVPRCLDLGWGYERSYTLPLILMRFLVALPFFAAVTGIAGMAAAEGAKLLWPGDTLVWSIIAYGQYSLEIALYTGIAFSFEALMLRSGRELTAAEDAFRDELGKVDAEEYRELRESWNARNT